MRLPLSAAFKLYLICQRYKFESESQLVPFANSSFIGCIQYVKDTNLKANHNEDVFFFDVPRAVFNMSKIQI